jgi:predicted translin family RNA/ssDNA-binding protein
MYFVPLGAKLTNTLLRTEYGEAVFFLEWIRTGRLASLDCSLLRDCSVGEITGAIMDVTGEVNRMAVALATNRDIEGVKACLAIVESIYFETQTMESKFIDGKWPVLRSTLTKMENLVLDLKLSQASGGMHSFVADSAPAYPNGSQFKGREAAEDEDDD